MGNGDKKISKSETASKKESNAEKRARNRKNEIKNTIFFGKQQYQIIVAGLVIVVIGLLLMSGGNNPPENWDANAIYNWRRITLAPFVILSGLAVVIYAIFKPSTAA